MPVVPTNNAVALTNRYGGSTSSTGSLAQQVNALQAQVTTQAAQIAALQAGTGGTTNSQPNLLLTTNLTAANYALVNGATVAVVGVSGDGHFNTYALTYPALRSGLQYAFLFTLNQTYTASVWAQGSVPFLFDAWDGTPSGATKDHYSPLFTPTSVPTRFSFSFTLASDVSGAALQLLNSDAVVTPVAGTNTYWGLKLELGSADTGSIPDITGTPPATAITWNPSDKNADTTLSNGNLTALHGAVAGREILRATRAPASGKWYFEIHLDVRGANQAEGGVSNFSEPTGGSTLGATAGASLGFYNNGTVRR